MNVFCIKNVKRDNFHDVYVFLSRINCYITSAVWSVIRAPMDYRCDIFIDKPTDTFTLYSYNGYSFFSWVGTLQTRNYKHPVIDADDLKGGGMCITNPRELTTTIILN